MAAIPKKMILFSVKKSKNGYEKSRFLGYRSLRRAPKFYILYIHVTSFSNISYCINCEVVSTIMFDIIFARFRIAVYVTTTVAFFL